MSAEGAERSGSTRFGRGLQAGDRIAERYEVIREIGAGGMGQVVEVAHMELEKRFALKLVRPDRWDAALETRFRREARALARVSSPRVAQITDFGVDAERGPFYVMELVEGEPLDELIRREGPLSHDRGMALAIGIAQALVDVHEAGIVHRDIKPGNIGVCTRGPVEVRLLDFGLAASVDDRLGSRITETQRVVGSMPYMAPEQFHNAKPSITMDVWALGIVLYEMWTARLPFDAPSAAALIHQILTAPPPAIHSVPHGGTAVLARLLAKDPSARVQTARDALALLQHPPDVASDAALASMATAEAERVGSDWAAKASTRSEDALVLPQKGPSRTTALVTGIALGLLGLITLVGSIAWMAGRSSSAVPSAQETAAAVDAGSARGETAASDPPERAPVATIARPTEPVQAEPVQAEPVQPEAVRIEEVAEAAPAGARGRAVAEGTRPRVRAATPEVEVTEPTPQPEPEPIPPEPEAEAPWTGGIIESPTL